MRDESDELAKGLAQAVARVLLWPVVAVLSLSVSQAALAQTFTTLKSFGILTNVTGWNPDCQLVQGADGTLYGTAFQGEGNVDGTVFKVQPDGSGFTVLKWFTNSLEGTFPDAGLTLSGSVLYGTTYRGGSSAVGGSLGFGTVFKLNIDGTGYTVLRHFTGNDDGAHPDASLMLSDGTLYGTTYFGGGLSGTVFKLNTNGTGYTVLKRFTGSDGANPSAGLTLSGSTLYGTTSYGGNSDKGTVFKLNTDGTGYTVLKHFTGSDGQEPHAGLTFSGSVLHGTTYRGGSSGAGTVFKLNANGTGYTVVKNFTGSDGSPYAGVALSGSTLYGTTVGGGSLAQGTVFKVNTDGTGYTVLKNFTLSDGRNPFAGLILSGSVLYGTTEQGGNPGATPGFGTVFKLNTDGTGYMVLKNFSYSDAWGLFFGLTLSGNVLYGTTSEGGTPGFGTVFKLMTDGTGYTVLKHFTNSDGQNPNAGLTLSGSALYGTTCCGGSSNYGTVYKLNTDGTGYKVLKQFTGSDGANPEAGLTLSGSVLFGTTHYGGSSYDGTPFSGYGTVFQVNTDGTGYTVLKDFTGGDGASPYGNLTLSNSALYGTTYGGGSSGYGTVFKLNTDGTGYMVLKHFTGSDGRHPTDGPTLYGSVLYGTTSFGGSSAAGSSLGSGTVFKLNTDGTGFTVLKDFSATTVDPSTGTSTNSDGASPFAGLTVSGNVLYGTTAHGGIPGSGTVFQVNTDGTGYTVLKHFTGSDGAIPFAAPALCGNVLYGTTGYGGSLNVGTVFKLDLSIPLTIQSLGNAVVLSWTNPAFALQAAPEVNGVYTNIPGAVSPSTNPATGPQRFFRLKMD